MSYPIVADSELQELVAQWEINTTGVAVFRPINGARIHVVRIGDRYSVLRYFKIADKWTVSCDAQNAQADVAFRALANEALG